MLLSSGYNLTSGTPIIQDINGRDSHRRLRIGHSAFRKGAWVSHIWCTT